MTPSARVRLQPDAGGAEDAQQDTAKTNIDLTPFQDAAFTEPVNDLVRLLSQTRRAFLIGAGCSKYAGIPLMDRLTEEVIRRLPKEDKARCVLEGLRKHFARATRCNIEDYLSELVDQLSILERRRHRGIKDAKAQIGDDWFSAEELLSAMASIKQQIAYCMSPGSIRPDVHRKFVRAVHNRLQSGKAGTHACVDYFILNYDTLFEDALAIEKISLADGFQGGATGWWDPSGFRRDACARVVKLHGSIDWCLWEGDILPRRIRDSVDGQELRERVLIWPAATKYRETQRDPYAQMIDIMRTALRPSERSEVVLTICGYSFGDSHIDIEIEEALQESQERLTVMAFTHHDKPEGTLAKWCQDKAIRDQVRVYANRGYYHGDDVRSSDSDLPWWQFEGLTRLLGGER